MIRLTLEREARQLSKAAFGRKAAVNDTRIRQAELHGLRLGEGELGRLSAALDGYVGAPHELLDEIDA